MEEPQLPNLEVADTRAEGPKRITLADVETMRPRPGSDQLQAVEYARIELALPSTPWDRALLLEDIVKQTLLDPQRRLDAQYAHLRLQFLNDTGTRDLVPDFVEENEDLHGVWRRLDRMGVSLTEQLAHVNDAFGALADYMEAVFRPRHLDYEREPWPVAPKATPGKAPGEVEPVHVVSEDWTGRTDPATRARRVLSLAPLAIRALEQLIAAAEQARQDNGPPMPLDTPELSALRELHRELGELIRQAKRRHDLDGQLAVVAGLVRRSFGVLRTTGDLIVADVPPLAAAMVPAWATFAICRTMLGLGEEAGGALAAATLAGHATLAAARRSRAGKAGSDGSES